MSTRKSYDIAVTNLHKARLAGAPKQEIARLEKQVATLFKKIS